MTVEKFAISFERELARLVRKSAANEPTSAWLADAARRKLRAEGLLEVVSDWEHLHGDVTVAELQHEENRQRSALADRRTAARGATFDSATKKATNATNTANAAKATKATKAAKAKKTAKASAVGQRRPQR